MKNPVLMVALIVMTVAVGHFGTAFAMHDSTLDVNTWIARNNTTQLHTIDLNNGPISPPDTAGASTQDPTPGPVTPIDEDEDQASNDDEDEDTLFEEDERNRDDED